MWLFTLPSQAFFGQTSEQCLQCRSGWFHFSFPSSQMKLQVETGSKDICLPNPQLPQRKEFSHARHLSGLFELALAPPTHDGSDPCCTRCRRGSSASAAEAFANRCEKRAAFGHVEMDLLLLCLLAWPPTTAAWLQPFCNDSFTGKIPQTPPQHTGASKAHQSQGRQLYLE